MMLVGELVFDRRTGILERGLDDWECAQRWWQLRLHHRHRAVALDAHIQQGLALVKCTSPIKGV